MRATSAVTLNMSPSVPLSSPPFLISKFVLLFLAVKSFRQHLEPQLKEGSVLILDLGKKRRSLESASPPFTQKATAMSLQAQKTRVSRDMRA